jgi:histone deacetylase complex regulatory component SIN3
MEIVLQGHPYLIRGFNKFLPSGYFVRDLYY